jgi:uncharacterized protein
MNNAVNYPLFRSFFLFCFVSFISVLTHAMSPELLDQLKKNHVVDTTQTLSLEEIEQLKLQNEQLYKQKNIDFKILMVPTIGETSIEEYALTVFNSIKIGDEKLDKGLLLVVAKNDRKMRLEVGYGLEGDITDIQAGRLIRNVLAPKFRENEYYLGIAEAQIQVAQIFGLNVDLMKIYKPINIKEKFNQNLKSIPEKYDMDYSSNQDKNSVDENTIDLSQPSNNIINYIAFFLWNLCVSTLFIVYLAPISYSLFKENLNTILLKLFIFFYSILHLIFCWIITGLHPFTLIIICFALFLSVLLFNYYWDIYLKLKKYIFPKLKHSWKFILFSYLAILLGSGFFLLPPEIIPFIIFLVFTPFLIRSIWVVLHNILVDIKSYYPEQYQDLFIHPLPIFMKGSFSSRSSGKSKSVSSSRSSGGSSGGGGASGGW